MSYQLRPWLHTKKAKQILEGMSEKELIQRVTKEMMEKKEERQSDKKLR